MSNEDLKSMIMRDVAGQCACQKLREATRKVTRRYDEALKPVGIKGSQFTMLSVIACVDDTSLSALADRLGMERTTLIRNLKPLERDGLLETSDEGYRRSKKARITDAGLKTLEAALPRWRKAQDSLRQELGDSVWQQVRSGLGAVNALA